MSKIKLQQTQRGYSSIYVVRERKIFAWDERVGYTAVLPPKAAPWKFYVGAMERSRADMAPLLADGRWVGKKPRRVVLHV